MRRAFRRAKRGPGPLPAIVAGVLAPLLALLAVAVVLPAPALASSTTTAPEAYPNVNAPLAQDAKAEATLTTLNAYAEEATFHNAFTASKSVPHTGGGFVLTLFDFSQAFALARGLPHLSGRTWINYTGPGCPSDGNCGVKYQCNGATVGSYGVPPASVSTSSPCLTNLYANWTDGGTGQVVGSDVATQTFTVARVAITVPTQASVWAVANANDTQETLKSAVSFLGSAEWADAYKVACGCANASGTSEPTAYALAAAWWVPLPTGTWVTSETTVTDLDTNAALGSANFTNALDAVLLAWSDYTVSSANTSEHFAFAIFAPAQTAPGGAGAPPGGGAPVTGSPSGTVVLVMGNVSVGSPAYRAEATWENTAVANFTGSFYLEGSWLASATGVTLYENGAAVPAYEYAVTPTAIAIYAGFVPVTSQATVTFVAHYVPNPAWSFSETLFYFGGLPVTPAALVGLAGVVSALAAAWWKARTPESTNLTTMLTGGALFTLFWFAVVVL